MFSSTYSEARERFLAAASGAHARTFSFTLPTHRGARGEELAMDVAWLGASDAARLLIVSAGTHGVEGFSGSAVQCALLHDDELRAALATRGIATMLIHAVNPYGFSHLHRTNEDNIDLNRNAIDFSRPLPVNAGYAPLHPLLVPTAWPPSEQNEKEIAAFVQRQGLAAFRAAVSSGQYTHADGLFYGGKAPSWSVRTVAEVLRTHAARARFVGWIDVHTGLGPFGHGEKLYVGGSQSGALSRAQRWWGADVTSPGGDDSVSPDVYGPVCTLAQTCCTGAVAAIGLEFGTLPLQAVLTALRADAWRRNHPAARADQLVQIAQQLRDAFYCDRDDWKAMVLGQARVAVVQAMRGLESER